jgi:hypothetical protein
MSYRSFYILFRFNDFWTLDFEIWPNILLSPLCFAMLGNIDLIFGIVMSYRSSLHFVPGQWFLAELWLLDFEMWPKIQLSPVFFALLGDIDLIFGIWVYSDELQIKFTFCSGSMIFGSWTLKFGQIFSCHHIFSICLKILTWFLVYEYMYIIMRYRSNLHFVPVQWFLALGLWPNI